MAKDERWITIKGHHVLIGADGEPVREEDKKLFNDRKKEVEEAKSKKPSHYDKANEREHKIENAQSPEDIEAIKDVNSFSFKDTQKLKDGDQIEVEHFSAITGKPDGTYVTYTKHGDEFYSEGHGSFKSDLSDVNSLNSKHGIIPQVRRKTQSATFKNDPAKNSKTTNPKVSRDLKEYDNIYGRIKKVSVNFGTYTVQYESGKVINYESERPFIKDFMRTHPSRMYGYLKVYK